MLHITTSTGDGLFILSTSITLRDLEPQKEVFGEFFAISACNVHFKSELLRMAGDRPRQPPHEIFTIKRRFQQFKSRRPMFRGLRQRESKTATPLKVAILSLFVRLA